MTTKFELKNYHLTQLQERKKIFSLMFNSLKVDDALFKLSTNRLDFALISNFGQVKTTLNIDYTGDTVYFLVDYRKFDTVLQKFAYAESVNFSVSNSLLKIYTDTKKDLVNLQITVQSDDSSNITLMDDYETKTITDYRVDKHHLTVTDDLINNINLFNNLFDTNGRVNAIGLSNTDAYYSDRSVVVKSTLAEPLSDDLFEGLPEDDRYIYLHTDTTKLINLLYIYHNDFYFDMNYDILFWENGDTHVIFQNDIKNVVLPTDEQWEGIKPVNKDVNFSVNIVDFSNILDFFNGIYVETSWKPLSISTVANTSVTATYTNPLAEATKEFDGITCGYTGRFVLDADTLKKIISKEKDIVSEETNVTFVFDEDTCEEQAPGILIKIGDKFEAVMSKLNEQ